MYLIIGVNLVNQFKVGDRVCIAVAEDKEVESGRAGVTNKDKGVITKVSGAQFYVKWLTGKGSGNSFWSTTAEYLKLAELVTNRSVLHLLKK